MNTRDRSKYQYDVALSFAGEDREIAIKLVKLLKERNIKVFYDESEQAKWWGKNLHDFFADVFSNQAQYCIMLISSKYADKAWTNLERQNAQARAIKDHGEYILPIKLDDTKIPGGDPIGHIDLRHYSLEQVADLFKAKFEDASTPLLKKRSSKRLYQRLISLLIALILIVLFIVLMFLIFDSGYNNVKLKVNTNLNDWSSSKENLEIIVSNLNKKADLTAWIFNETEQVYYRQAIREISESAIYNIKTWPWNVEDAGAEVKVFATIHKQGKAPPNLDNLGGYWVEARKADEVGGIEKYLEEKGYKAYVISDIKSKKFEKKWQPPPNTFKTFIPDSTLEIITDITMWNERNNQIGVRATSVKSLSMLTVWIHDKANGVYYRQGYANISQDTLCFLKTWPKGVQNARSQVEIVATLHPSGKLPPDQNEQGYSFQTWKVDKSQGFIRFLAWEGYPVLAISRFKIKSNWDH